MNIVFVLIMYIFELGGVKVLILRSAVQKNIELLNFKVSVLKNK